MKFKFTLTLIVFAICNLSSVAQEFYGLKVHKPQDLDYRQDSLNWMSNEKIPDPFDAIYFSPYSNELTFQINLATPKVVEGLQLSLGEKFTFVGRSPESCDCESPTPGKRGDPDDICWCISTFIYRFEGKKNVSAILTYERHKGIVTIVFTPLGTGL